MHDSPGPTPPPGPAPSRAAETGPRGHDGALQDLLARNLGEVRARLDAAAGRSGRTAPTLVAVTKSVSVDVALALHGLGQPDLAENRADRFLEKAEAFAVAGASPTWHFVGHLQRNKARRVLERAHVLHSVDSDRLADAVVRLTGEIGRAVDVFVQVNLTGEQEKHGLAPGQALDCARRLAAGDHVRVLGLMAMGPLAERGGRTTAEVFRDAATLAASLTDEAPGVFVDGRCRLSMGMSGDAELAIEHGSDMVRVGSSLFVGLDEVAPPAQERRA